MEENRRKLLASLAGFTSLIGIGSLSRAFGGSVGAEVRALVSQIDGLSQAVRGGTVPVETWRAGVEELLSRIALKDLLDTIEFERLAAGLGFASRGVSTVKVRFGMNETRSLKFIPKLFALDRGRAIIPHGHGNMLSAHLTLNGALYCRQYDRIALDGEVMTIRQSFETMLGPGDVSSVGTDDDNVHWMIAREPSHTLDIIVTGLDPNAESRFDIYNLDIDEAEHQADGTLRTPRMPVAQALRKYG